MKNKILINWLIVFCLLNSSCLSNTQKENVDKLQVDLEVDAPDILRTLANYPSDLQFNKALDIAIEENKRGIDKDFVSIFVEKYDSIDNSSKLAYFFVNDFFYGINEKDSNAQVKETLYDVVQKLLDKSYQIFEIRIEKYGIQKPKIIARKNPECISIELTGIQNPQVVQKLLTKGLRIEFWKTYNPNDIQMYLNSINLRSKELLDQEINKSQQIQIATKYYKIEKSFFEYLNIDQIDKEDNHIIGLVNKKDTVVVNEILKKSSDSYPYDMSFAWGYNSAASDYVKLYVLRGYGVKRDCVITEDDIVSFKINQDFFDKDDCTIHFSMNAVGARHWEHITSMEIGNTVAILFNGYVYALPVINKKVEGGEFFVTGDFNFDELRLLKILFNSPKIPVDTYLKNVEITSDSIKH